MNTREYFNECFKAEVPKFLRVLNLVMGIGLLAGIPASFLFESTFFEFFSKRPPRIDPTWLVPVLRIWLVLALPMVAAVHVSLSRLLAVVETVRSGDPFVPQNAARLKTIAWCARVWVRLTKCSKTPNR